MSFNTSNSETSKEEILGKPELITFRIPRSYCGSTASTDQLSDSSTEILDLHDFIRDFLVREHQLWQDTINTSVFQPVPTRIKSDTNSSQNSQNTLSASIESNNSAGDSLLRHSQFLNEIHDYFVKLDYRHCCVTNESLVSSDEVALNLATGYMKVLNHGISVTEKQAKSKKKKSFLRNRPTADIPQLNLLNTQDKEIYKFALRCAHFPVLCCPQTPQPSPCIAHQCSSLVLNGSTSSPTAASPTDSLAIEKSSLLTLLRNAFELDLSVHEMYEKETLRRNGNPCNAVVELLRELQNNRVLLEENKHPIYKMSAFLFADGYEKWRIKELNSVRQLIRRICPQPISSLPVTNKLDTINCLEYYTILESRLTKYELTQRSTNGDGNDTLLATDNVLSTASKRLLKEFAYRYGVGEVYRKISSLHCLASYFTANTWSIKCANHSVQSILRLLQAHYQVFLRTERDMLLEALNVLLQQTKHSLESIGMLCPRYISYEGINAFVNLLNSIVQVQYKFEEWDDNSPSIHDMLSKCINNAAEESYKSIRSLALIDYDPMDYDDKLSPKVLRRILHDIRAKCKQFNEIEENCFCLQSYISVIKIVVKKLYCLFIKDVKEVIINRTEETRTSSVDYELLGLAYRLDKLDEEWKKFISIKDQRWRLYFILEARLITKSITERVLSLIKRFVCHDQETALTVVNQLDKVSESKIRPYSSDIHTKEQVFMGSNNLVQSSNSAFQSVSTVDKVDTRSLNLQQSPDSFHDIDATSSNKQTTMSTSPIKVQVLVVNQMLNTSSHESICRPNNPTPCHEDDCSNSSSFSISTFSSREIQSPRFSSPINLSSDTSRSYTTPLVIDSTQCSHISQLSNKHKYNSDSNLKESENNSANKILIKNNEYEPVLVKTVSLPNTCLSYSKSMNSNELLQGNSSILSKSNQSESFKSITSLIDNDSTLRTITDSELSSEECDSPVSFNSIVESLQEGNRQKYCNGNIKNGKILITSSLVDTFITLLHLLRFCGEICELLSPKQRFELDEANGYFNRKEADEISIDIRKEICRELTKSIATIAHAYGDNVFALDLCGLSKVYFTEQLSKQISRHMIEMIKRGLLCGCRHLKNDSLHFDKNRNEFSFTACSWLKKRKSYAVLGWEKVSPQTCLRINNIYYMRKELITLQKICYELCGVEMLPFAEDDDLFADWDKDIVKIEDESDWELCVSLVTTAQYLTAVYHHQLMLIVKRVMDLFESVLYELLKLHTKDNDDRQVKWKNHLLPLEKIVKEHADLFDNNLIPVLKDQIKEGLFVAIIEVVSNQIDKLRESGMRSADNAFCLWYSIEMCCNTLNIDCKNDNEMAARVNYIGMRLEIFTMTTYNLGELFNLIECARHDKLGFCKLSISEAICSIQEKCGERVSGTELITILQEDLLVYNAFTFRLKLDGFGLREKYKTLRIAQYLLSIKAFECVTVPFALQETRQPGLVIVRSPGHDKYLSPSVSIDGSRISFDDILSDDESDSDNEYASCESEGEVNNEEREADFIASFKGNPNLKFLPLSNAFYSPLNTKTRASKDESLRIRFKEILCCEHLNDVCSILLDDCVAVLNSKWLIQHDVDALELLITVPGHSVQTRCSCPF